MEQKEFIQAKELAKQTDCRYSEDVFKQYVQPLLVKAGKDYYEYTAENFNRSELLLAIKESTDLVPDKELSALVKRIYKAGHFCFFENETKILSDFISYILEIGYRDTYEIILIDAIQNSDRIPSKFVTSNFILDVFAVLCGYNKFMKKHSDVLDEVNDIFFPFTNSYIMENLFYRNQNTAIFHKKSFFSIAQGTDAERFLRLLDLLTNHIVFTLKEQNISHNHLLGYLLDPVLHPILIKISQLEKNLNLFEHLLRFWGYESEFVQNEFEQLQKEGEPASQALSSLIFTLAKNPHISYVEYFCTNIKSNQWGLIYLFNLDLCFSIDYRGKLLLEYLLDADIDFLKYHKISPDFFKKIFNYKNDLNEGVFYILAQQKSIKNFLKFFDIHKKESIPMTTFQKRSFFTGMTAIDVLIKNKHGPFKKEILAHKSFSDFFKKYIQDALLARSYYKAEKFLFLFRTEGNLNLLKSYAIFPEFKNKIMENKQGNVFNDIAMSKNTNILYFVLKYFEENYIEYSNMLKKRNELGIVPIEHFSSFRDIDSDKFKEINLFRTSLLNYRSSCKGSSDNESEKSFSPRALAFSPSLYLFHRLRYPQESGNFSKKEENKIDYTPFF